MNWTSSGTVPLATAQMARPPKVLREESCSSRTCCVSTTRRWVVAWGFAVEVNELFRLKRAMEAMRYFGLAELADLVADLVDHDLNGDYAESRQDDLYTLLGPRDEVLETAFRVKAAERPADFGLE
jgi:hypothetical protein